MVKKIAKLNDLVKNYIVCVEYPRFPKSELEQRELVGLFYDHIKKDSGRISIDDAKDGRIYYVAKKLYENAKKEMGKMNHEDIILIKRIKELGISSYRGRPDELEERIGILLSDANPSEHFITRLNQTLKLRGYDFYLSPVADTTFNVACFGGSDIDELL